MMKPGSLRPLFSSILLGHLGVAAAGCSQEATIEGAVERPPSGENKEPPPPRLSTEGFDPFSCDPLLLGASAALGVDSIERWSFNLPNRFNDKEPFVFTATRLESDGVACASAPDRPICLIALERARTEPSPSGLLGLVDGLRADFAERLVVTKGGEVRTVDDAEDLRALLGPIDALEKLRLFAGYSQSNVPCQYVRPIEAGFELIGVVGGCYSEAAQNQRVQVTRAGEEVWFEGKGASGFCLGRRPAGLLSQAPNSGGALGRYLERQAYLEGASVEAFERFARELEAFGAPPALVTEARRARADEVRHHALAVSLGRRFDPSFECAPPEARPAAPRSLFAFALENAVEGCVRETWGALLAHYQAARAADGAVRFACALIADDETRHADLSWATHRWLLGRLDAGERRALELGMRREAERLVDEIALTDGLTPRDMALLGLPSDDEARALLARLDEALWAEPLAA